MGDSNVIGELLVRMGLDSKSFDTAMGKVEGKMQNLERNLANTGASLMKNVSAPLIAAGAVAVKVANDFDKAYATIRTGTGATGETLEGLKVVMESLYAELPNDLSQVSTAVADLNTMFGVQGEQLEEMATQYLNLARITGTDVASVIQTSARLFGDWSIATEDQADMLDYLFRVTQSTGVTIGDLSTKMVQYGASLRQMGFDAETAAALLGKFHKEGVNTEVVLGSMRIALANMAREGVTDASDALQTLITRIQEAGTASEANAIAIEVFGSKAGVDMSAAIREGRFELDELLVSLRESTDTINGVGDETRTFSEEIKILKHHVELALQPLGALIIDTLLDNKTALEDVVGVFAKLVEAFKSLPDPVENAMVKIALMAAALGPVLYFSAKLIGVMGALKTGVLAASGAMATLGATMGVTVTPLAAQMGLLGISADAALGLTTLGYGLIGGMAAYTLYDLVSTAKDATKGEDHGPLNYYMGYNAQSGVYDMSDLWETETPIFNEAAIEKSKVNIQEVIGFANEALGKQINELQVKILTDLAEGEIDSIRAELEAGLSELNVTFAGRFSDQTAQYLEQMQSATEEYKAKYDIGTGEGLSFAIESLAAALDPETLKSMGYSDEQIVELQKSVSIAGEQLTTQSNIAALAETAATNLGLSAEEQKIAKEYIEGILTTAEEYKVSTGALLESANEKIEILNGQIEFANTTLGSIDGGIGGVGTAITNLGTAIKNMPPPVVNVSPPKVEVNINNIPTMAEGGYTGNYEGLAYLHPDEYVVPSGKMNSTDQQTNMLLSTLIDAVRGLSSGGTTNIFGANFEELTWKLKQGGSI